MPRTLLITLVAFLAIPFSAIAEDAPKPLPAVKRILDKAAVEVKENRQEFDKANEKPLGEARSELKELSTKLIQDGKTKDATAVLKQIETLEADVARMANAPAPVAGGGKPVPQKSLLERMAGKWNRPGNPDFVVINNNGTVSAGKKANGLIFTSVQLVFAGGDKAEAIWESGWRSHFRLAGDDFLAVSEWDPKANQTDGYVLERMK